MILSLDLIEDISQRLNVKPEYSTKPLELRIANLQVSGK